MSLSVGETLASRANAGSDEAHLAEFFIDKIDILVLKFVNYLRSNPKIHPPLLGREENGGKFFFLIFLSFFPFSSVSGKVFVGL